MRLAAASAEGLVCVCVCVCVRESGYRREAAFVCKAARVHELKCVRDGARQREHLSAADRLKDCYLKFPSQSASN